MFLSRIFNSMNVSMQEHYMTELLELNEETKAYGLTLTPDDIQQMMAVRNQVLKHYGRVELGIDVSKEFIKAFASSPYIDADNFAPTLNELHEIFYDLKNETEDQIGDFKLIDLMQTYFDEECGGSLELLRSKLEEYAVGFRSELQLNEFLLQGDDD